MWSPYYHALLYNLTDDAVFGGPTGSGIHVNHALWLRGLHEMHHPSLATSVSDPLIHCYNPSVRLSRVGILSLPFLSQCP